MMKKVQAGQVPVGPDDYTPDEMRMMHAKPDFNGSSGVDHGAEKTDHAPKKDAQKSVDSNPRGQTNPDIKDFL